MEDIPLAIWAYDPTATYNNVDGTYDNLIWIQPGSKPSENDLTNAYNTYINTANYKKTVWFEELQRDAQEHLRSLLDGPNTYIVLTALWRNYRGLSIPARYEAYGDDYADKVVSIQQVVDSAQDALVAMSGVTTVSTYQTWYDTYLAQIEAVT